MTEVWLSVEGYRDSDSDERAKLAWELQGELRELDVEDVSRPPAPSPEGAKGDALQWAQLVVTLVGTLPALMAAVRRWLSRHPGTAITLEINGDRLELDDASAGERSELISAWLARHGG